MLRNDQALHLPVDKFMSHNVKRAPHDWDSDFETFVAERRAQPKREREE